MNSSLHATTNGGDGESASKSVLNVGGSGKGCISPFTITDMCLPPLQSHHVSAKPRRKVLDTNSAIAPEGGLPRGQTTAPWPFHNGGGEQESVAVQAIYREDTTAPVITKSRSVIREGRSYLGRKFQDSRLGQSR